MNEHLKILLELSSEIIILGISLIIIFNLFWISFYFLKKYLK